MCGFDFFQPFNDRARCSDIVVHRLPAWQAFSCDDAETLVSSVSDGLYFCTLSDFDDNVEALYTFNPAAPLNATGSPYTDIDFNPDLKNATVTGTMSPGRNGQGSQTLYLFTGVQHG